MNDVPAVDDETGLYRWHIRTSDEDPQVLRVEDHSVPAGYSGVYLLHREKIGREFDIVEYIAQEMWIHDRIKSELIVEDGRS